MFAAYCPRHEARVLLWPSCITAVDKRARGLAVQWRCPCGGEGTTEFGN